jgi:hypothetical protein
MGFRTFEVPVFLPARERRENPGIILSKVPPEASDPEPITETKTYTRNGVHWRVVNKTVRAVCDVTMRAEEEVSESMAVHALSYAFSVMRSAMLTSETPNPMSVVGVLAGQSIFDLQSLINTADAAGYQFLHRDNGIIDELDLRYDTLQQNLWEAEEPSLPL